MQRDDLKLAQVRASYPKGPQIGGSTRADSADHISAALMIRAGYSAAAEKCFTADVMQQSRPLHAASLVDLCRASLAIDHRDCPQSRDAMIRAALSGGSMPVALDDSANKVLVEAYRTAPSSWRSFAQVRPAANFKQQTGIRPSVPTPSSASPS